MLPLKKSKQFPCPTVPLSWDKRNSKNPGKTPLSRDKKSDWQKKVKKLKQMNFFQNCNFLNSFSLSFPWLSQDIPGRNRLSKSCPSKTSNFRPCGKILNLSSCPFVPGHKSFACHAVPKSCCFPCRWKA